MVPAPVARRADRPRSTLSAARLAAHAVPGARRRRATGRGTCSSSGARDHAHRSRARPDAPRRPGRPEMAVVLAIDAGTTGVRTVAVDEHGTPGRVRVPRVPAALPAAGLGRARRRRHLARGVRHARRGRRAALDAGETVAAIGITNQRETVVVWDRAHRAAACTARSCGRTAAPRPRCDELRAAGHEPLVRARTGLVLDPYFSATKLEWLLTEGGVERRRRPRVRHRRLVDAAGTSPAAPTAACTRPTRRTRAARCSSTSTRSTWSRRAARRCSTSRRRACPRCGRSAGASA